MILRNALALQLCMAEYLIFCHPYNICMAAYNLIISSHEFYLGSIGDECLGYIIHLILAH